MHDEEPHLEPYLRQIAGGTGMTVAEEHAAWRRARQGDATGASELVRRNLCFVVSVAKNYRGFGLSFADLIAEGNLGLVVAAQRFDATRGCKFITYAVWWIRHAILKALAGHARAVRVPTNRLSELFRMARAQRLLAQRLQREPAPSELAAAMHAETERVRLMMSMDQPVFALEGPLGPELQDRSRHEIIADPMLPDGEEAIERDELSREVRVALGALAPVEARVLIMYFGLDGNPAMTLEEIGARFRRSRERIRQIKARALAKLRHPGRASRLREHLA